jgi:hypothetical protein
MDDCSCSEKSMMLAPRIGSSQHQSFKCTDSSFFTSSVKKGKDSRNWTDQVEHTLLGSCLHQMPLFFLAMFNWLKGKLMDAQYPTPRCLFFPTTYCPTPFGLSHHSVQLFLFIKKNAEKSDNEIFRIQK